MYYLGCAIYPAIARTSNDHIVLPPPLLPLLEMQGGQSTQTNS